MKLSFSTSFSKLTLFMFAAVILLMVGGGIVSSQSDPGACVGWPLCIPQGTTGWALLLHRVSVVFTTVIMGVLLIEAWRRHRDHLILLPLTTSITTLFLAQGFIGAIYVSKGFTRSLYILHSSTALILWLAFLGLVISAGIFSRETGVKFPPLEIRQRAKDYLALSKPIIALLLLFTTYAGLVMGKQGFPSFSLAFWTLLGGGLTAIGSGALNQYIDRNLDKLMQRTSKRPLAAERMTPAEGMAFGLSTCIIGVYILAVFVNFLAALLSFIGILYYVILYSVYLKKATVHNVLIGGGAGAIPPMVGWVAATGSLTFPAWVLFAIIFFWTPPHFWALAIVRTKEYERVGIPMLPVVHGEKETRRQILLYTIGLVIFTLALPILKVAGNIYFVLSFILGCWLIYTAWRVYKIEGNKVAWKMYRISSMYLAFIFVALMIDAVI